ncbi:hypothetical protein BU17DRAFT_7119, partial [Hysterangium stoloniferum]
SYLGLSGPFQNYLQNLLPLGSTSGAPLNGVNGMAGALNMGQTAMTGLQDMFSFLVYMMPIVCGIITDIKWGQFVT